MQLHSTLLWRTSLLLAVCTVCFIVAPPARASSQLALDKGCYSCHGTPPRKNAPTFEQISADYAKYQGQSDAATRLARKLREGHIFGGISSHEQLTEENALIIVRWLIDSSK